MTPDTTIAIQKAADLVDATPYVIGFHPTDSLVVLGISGGRVFFGARYDLPPPDSDDIMHLGAVVAAQRARCVALLAYGPPSAADAVIKRTLAVFDAFRVRVLEAVRVHDGRWWSYFCSNAVCCPAEGTPFDTATSLIAAEATYRGQVVLPNRQALVAQVAPVEGEARALMARATVRSRALYDAILTDQERGERTIRRDGRFAIREAEKRYRSGCTLNNDEAAWLGVLLLNPDVNEYILNRLGDEEWRLALWTDMLRRVEPPYVAPVGSVLGYLAWRAGQGALARVAVDRALHADPEHPMSALLDEVLGLGIGPHAMAALDSPPRPSFSRPAHPTLRFTTPRPENPSSRSKAAPTGTPQTRRAKTPPKPKGEDPPTGAADPAARDAASPLSEDAAAPGGARSASLDGTGLPSPGGAGPAASGEVDSATSRRTDAPLTGQGSATSSRSGPSSPEPGRPPRRERRLRRALRRRSQ